VVGLLAAEIFGYQDRLTQKYALDLGLAFQLTNILRDVHEDAQRGRFYIPNDEMVQFGVTRDDFIEGRMHDGMRQLLAMQAERAESYYERAFARLPEADRYAQRSGVIMSAIYHRILQRIIELDYPVLKQRVKLSSWHKLWLAWRCYRTEKKRARLFQRKQASTSNAS
jgi:15-cis-phytoene synthase